MLKDIQSSEAVKRHFYSLTTIMSNVFSVTIVHITAFLFNEHTHSFMVRSKTKVQGPMCNYHYYLSHTQVWMWGEDPQGQGWVSSKGLRAHLTTSTLDPPLTFSVRAVEWKKLSLLTHPLLIVRNPGSSFTVHLLPFQTQADSSFSIHIISLQIAVGDVVSSLVYDTNGPACVTAF